MVRAAIYTRVSTLNEKGTETSTARQERACRAFCEARGWEVARVFTDSGRSAFTGRDRPGWLALEAAVDAREADAVVVFAISRAARNTLRLLRFKELCDGRGAAFESVSEPIGGEYGPVLLAILASLAQLESQARRDRITEWHAEKRANGEWAGGRVLFGYERDAERGLRPVEEQARLVRDAAERVLAGASLLSICRDWNARGLRTSAGMPWNAKTLRVLLESERIAGLLDGKRATWSPIITRRDHARLVRLFAQRSGPDRKSRARTGRYLLTGLVECGRCGGRLVGRPDKGVPRYVCVRRKGHALSIDARALDELVTRRAADMLVERDAVADPAELPEELLAARAAVESELEELAATPDLTPGEWRVRRAPLVERLRELDALLEDVTTRRPTRTYFAELGEEPDLDAYLADPALRPWLEQLLEAAVIAPAVPGQHGFHEGRVSFRWREGVRHQLDDIEAPHQ
ncbi:MAG: recombinase family protein [Actinobacteria bacterium]|nr:recombinase family protein [Actinomycetota bacterium]